MTVKYLKVTLVKSMAKRIQAHQASVRGLGLRRIRHTVVVANNVCDYQDKLIDKQDKEHLCRVPLYPCDDRPWVLEVGSAGLHYETYRNERKAYEKQ